MRVLFWGTPEFALPSLRALLGEGHEVVGVVTQPDRPAGRGRTLRPSPVREVAEAEGIPVFTPVRPRGEAVLAELRALDPDLSVVVAYGHLLRPEVLSLPRHGSLNVHASLLPELRGAAPVNWALLRGDTRTGITVMRMTEGMDEGPILLQREVPIEEEDTASSVALRLSEVGAEALVEALALLETGLLEEREQAHERATWAPKIGREDARIDWSRPSREIANRIRGMDRVPGAWTLLGEVPIKLFRPRVVAADASGHGAGSSDLPGTVVASDPEEGLRVRTGDGAIEVGEVQPAGRRRMEARDWLRGGGVRVGERFL